MNVLYCQINDKSLNSETLNIKTIYLIKLLKLQQLLTEAKMCIHVKKKQTFSYLEVAMKCFNFCQKINLTGSLFNTMDIFVADVSFIIVFSI